MKMLNSALNIAALMVLALRIQAQVDTRPQLFRYQHLLLNPAYAGMEDQPVAGLTGIFGTSSFFSGANMLGSYDQPVAFAHGGAGIIIDHSFYRNPSFSKQQNFGAGLLYSYHITTENWKLGIGTQISARQYRYRNLPEKDPTFPHIHNQTNTYPDVDLGLWLKRSNFYAGLSAKHLFEPVTIVLPETWFGGRREVRHQRYFNLTSGYTFTLSPLLKLSPAALYETSLRHGILSGNLRLNNTVIVADKWHAGLTLNSLNINFNSSFTLHAGADLGNRGRLMLGTTLGGYNRPAYELQLQIGL